MRQATVSHKDLVLKSDSIACSAQIRGESNSILKVGLRRGVKTRQ